MEMGRVLQMVGCQPLRSRWKRPAEWSWALRATSGSNSERVDGAMERLKDSSIVWRSSCFVPDVYTFIVYNCHKSFGKVHQMALWESVSEVSTSLDTHLNWRYIKCGGGSEKRRALVLEMLYVSLKILGMHRPEQFGTFNSTDCTQKTSTSAEH